MTSHRPEQVGPADVFYNEREAEKYTVNTRMINIQTQLTLRALEILAIPRGKQKMLLDIGCGSGISGNILGTKGHMWMGMDISKAMLKVAVDREVEGDVIHCDMGHGFGFRDGSFDGAVSISALQWLCSAEQAVQNPFKRLNKFFASLYACLIKGARCAFQFYPSSPEQVEMITSAAMRNGFTGGLIVDFPNSKKARKYFLFLMAGYSEQIIKEAEEAVFLPKARTDGEDYDFNDEDGDDSDMEDCDSDDEENKEDGEAEGDESDDDDDGFKKKDRTIKQVGRRRDSKAI